ncbi:MAG TPA: CoA pyrophosphatase [Gammaproteobacteria bacterium]|nr:CoA pyrophosphatase [Gammaproteobacteria bacterium]
MFEDTAGGVAGPAADEDRLAPRLQRLAQALEGNESRIWQPAFGRLRRAGFLANAPLLPAAVLIVLLEQSGGTGILLTRRCDDLAAHPGQVAFPGGAQESGDRDAEAAALREAEEEVALRPERVRILGRLPRYPTTTGYLVTPIVGHVAEAPTLRAQVGEVADIFVLPLPILLDSSRWEMRPLGVGAEPLLFPELAWKGQRIWGATAGMLQLLLPPLRAAWNLGE